MPSVLMVCLADYPCQNCRLVTFITCVRKSCHWQSCTFVWL